jgi:ATP-binding cassette subfamily F protein 3
MCGAFMFSGDDIDKPAKVLSGGERARVALARLCIAPGNLLLMDEPTNHLDLASSESLAQSLTTYDGTLVFVSHNRSLIRQLATRIWNVEDGKVETYPGTLDEYMYSMAQRRQGLGEAEGNGRSDGKAKGAAPPQPKGAASAADDKARKRREAEARQKRAATIGPLEKQVAQLEERIATLETEQKVRSAELADPTVYDDAARRNKLLADYQTASDKLEELTARWETAMAQLESAKTELEKQTN